MKKLSKRQKIALAILVGGILVSIVGVPIAIREYGGARVGLSIVAVLIILYAFEAVYNLLRK